MMRSAGSLSSEGGCLVQQYFGAIVGVARQFRVHLTVDCVSQQVAVMTPSPSSSGLVIKHQLSQTITFHSIIGVLVIIIKVTQVIRCIEECLMKGLDAVLDLCQLLLVLHSLLDRALVPVWHRSMFECVYMLSLIL